MKEKEREEIWHFLYKEWSKLHDLIYAYNKIARNAEIKENRYNAAFQLLMDSLTRSIAITIDLFFQNSKRYWSLYSLDYESKLKKDIDKVKKEAEFCIILRSNNFAHLPKEVEQKGNFRFFNFVAIDKLKDILNNINDILITIGRNDGRDESYTEGFIGVQDEVGLLIEDLKK